MTLTLLFLEEDNKYLALIQWSTIIYWDVLKSRVHLLIPTATPQFHIISYRNNQHFSYLYITLYVWEMGRWVEGWVSL